MKLLSASTRISSLQMVIGWLSSSFFLAHGKNIRPEALQRAFLELFLSPSRAAAAKKDENKYHLPIDIMMSFADRNREIGTKFFSLSLFYLQSIYVHYLISAIFHLFRTQQYTFENRTHKIWITWIFILKAIKFLTTNNDSNHVVSAEICDDVDEWMGSCCCARRTS